MGEMFVEDEKVGKWPLPVKVLYHT